MLDLAMVVGVSCYKQITGNPDCLNLQLLMDLMRFNQILTYAIHEIVTGEYGNK